MKNVRQAVKSQRMIFQLAAVALASSLFTWSVAADSNGETMVDGSDHRQAIETWRTARHERLMRPDGWLTLVGLEWLQEGENRVGSAEGNDIRLSGGPDDWGSVFVEGKQLRFITADSDKVKINGASLAESELVADTEGTATVVSSGTLSFHVIFRASYALRIKDSKAPTLQNFTGVDNYPIDANWRIDGLFVKAEEGASIEIANVLGQISESPVYGSFEFDMQGNTHSLLALGTEASKNLWFIFSDRTSGRGTYGAGRFLYSDGMPQNGRLVVDFNKAYNPPCAFNPYSTCPLPPQRNRMDLKVTAGEKDFHPDTGHYTN
ncbi:MAG: DUF1684 domain-containing protein [Xanthomonadales bacterium]|nr:DUF1684 domain-containing protein [Gammaproteobacteria bacterium]MBT8073612.1 DUF1684 domain-containing protein [Gammaproteobacteria bacterium]MBT8075583.1 DUF1684 domain-containing protein [Gammaproteobacteria bacterium]NNK04454.1 DUF1684 domain-containing protein [Xanthomonadales bacterium]NNK98725.1 DUF1684 domain-containing protein [Xanthomonadales bacterium]